MLIQEAIKSGKPFRRKSWTGQSQWVVVMPDGQMMFYSGGDAETYKVSPFSPSVQSMFSDDWETKE